MYEVCPEVQPLLIQREWFVWHRCSLAAKESGLECLSVNYDNFTVDASWVSMCIMWPLHSKRLSQQNNKSASNFALSLNVPLEKILGWFRRPQLWATGDWQLHHNNAPTHPSRLIQSILVKYQITQVTQPTYSPDLVPCDFWLFPKLKSSLKGKRSQTIDKIQENTTGQLMVIGRTVWGPKVPTLKRGLRCHCPVYNVSCILHLLQ